MSTPSRQRSFPPPSPQDSLAHEQYFPDSKQPDMQHYQQESYYSQEPKVPQDDQMYSSNPNPVYPPFPPQSQHPYLQSSAPDLRPSMSVHLSSQSAKPFNSSIDLETLNTDEGTERTTHPVLDKKKEIESGLKAALWPASMACRAYLLAVLLETIINISIEAFVLMNIDALADSVPLQVGGSITRETRQPVYLGIFVLAHVLQMILAIDAVFNKNTLQFLFLVFFNFSLCMYGAIQVIEIQDNVVAYQNRGATLTSGVLIKVLTISVPCVVAVAEVAYVALGWRIWKEFGWQVYKFLGADRNIKKIYAQYQIFQCLLKFDIFFWVGFSVQWLSLVLKTNDFEFYLTLAALPLSLLLLIEGHLAARHESKWMMSTFMFGNVAGVAYFIYKAYKIFMDRSNPDFEHLYKSLLIFACVSIILLITTFIWGFIVMRNFGQGLKHNMNKKESEHKLERRATEYKRSGTGRYPPLPNPKRMSIE